MVPSWKGTAPNCPQNVTVEATTPTLPFGGFFTDKLQPRTTEKVVQKVTERPAQTALSGPGGRCEISSNCAKGMLCIQGSCQFPPKQRQAQRAAVEGAATEEVSRIPMLQLIGGIILLIIVILALWFVSRKKEHEHKSSFKFTPVVVKKERKHRKHN
jgi:hypothetical protein